MRLTDQVLRAIHWDTVSFLVTSGITFLATVWMVRVLGPERFGDLAAILATLALGQLLASGGIRYALLRFVPQAMQEQGPGAVTQLLIRAALGRTVALAIVTILLWFAADIVATFGLGRPGLARYVRLLPLLLALPLYADTLTATLIALFRQPAVRASEVANKLVFAFSLLLLPAWRDPVHGVFAAWIAGWATAVLWLTAEAVRQGLLRRPTRAAWVPTGRVLRFSGTALGLSLIGYVLGRELDILLLTRLGISGEAVAQYAVCFSFVGTILSLPLLPISGGFDVPLIARLHGRGDWDGLRRLFRAYFEYVYIFVLPLIGGGLLLGPSLVRQIYGASYVGTATILLPLLILLGLTKLGGITGPFLLATDQERVLFRIRLTMAAGNIGAALAAIPRFGPVGAALATGMTMLGLAVWEACVVQRRLRPQYPWGFLARITVATGAMMGAIRILQTAIDPDSGFLATLILVAFGGVTYLAMLLWLRPVSSEQSEILKGAGAPFIASLVHRIDRPIPGPATGTAGHGQP